MLAGRQFSHRAERGITCTARSRCCYCQSGGERGVASIFQTLSPGGRAWRAAGTSRGEPGERELLFGSAPAWNSSEREASLVLERPWSHAATGKLTRDGVLLAAWFCSGRHPLILQRKVGIRPQDVVLCWLERTQDIVGISWTLRCWINLRGCVQIRFWTAKHVVQGRSEGSFFMRIRRLPRASPADHMDTCSI